MAGKAPFTVRMPPDVYAALCRAAREDDFGHLGDWLAQLPGLAVKANQRIEPAGRLGPLLARRRFAAIAAKVQALTEELYDLVDFDASMAGDAMVIERFSALHAAHCKVAAFLRNHCPI